MIISLNLSNEQKNFLKSLILNYSSFVSTSISGLLFLLSCAIFLNRAGLGIVSLGLALYVIFSQLAVCGLHLSALQVSADNTLPSKTKKNILWSAIVITFIWSAIFSAFSFLSSNLISKNLSIEELKIAWQIVSPSLVFFAINKVIASIQNGLNKMGYFAFQSAFRSFSIAIIGSIIAFVSGNPILVFITFLATEIVLFIFQIFFLFQLIGTPHTACLKLKYFSEHLKFGLKGMLSGLAVEMNIRVDVLMVGYYLGPSSTGLYAFVAQIAEGFFNIIIVLRNVLVPKIANIMTSKKYIEFRLLAKKLMFLFFPLMCIASIIIVTIYNPLVGSLMPEKGFEDGRLALAILVCCFCFSSWVLCFDSIFVLAKKPHLFSLMMIATLFTNIFGNLVLLPIFGLYGASLSSGLASIFSAMYLIALAKIALGISLLPKFKKSDKLAR